MTFRLYDWGREFNPATARKMHLDEAMDIINYEKFDESNYRKGPAWGNEEKDVEVLAERPEFTVTKYKLTEPLRVSTEKFDSFMVYVCPEGEAAISVQTPKGMDNYILHKGETILVPAEVEEYFVIPRDKNTTVLEAYVARHEDKDQYINPDTEPFLEGEDYEGIDKEDEEEEE